VTTRSERYFICDAGQHPQEQRVCEFLSRCLRERGVSRTTVPKRATTRVRVTLDTSMPKDDTFRIVADHPHGIAEVALSSATGPGLYAAAGAWLRSGMAPLNVRSKPSMEARGIYFATHFNVCYLFWSVDQWRRYLEDLASWGMNLIWLQYDWRDYHPPWRRGHKRTFPEEARRWRLLTDVLRTAGDLGIKTGLSMTINEGFRGQADDRIRAKPMPRFTGDVAFTELCPSTSRGRKTLLDSHRRFFEMIPPIEHLLYWPLDPGGCGCEACTPWVGKTYLNLCRESARIVKKVHKGVRVYISDTYAEPKDHAMLIEALRGRGMGWLDGVVDAWDRWSDPFPCYSSDKARRQLASMARRVPKSYRFGVFPDLSMTFSRRPNGRDATDWGLTGANPHPARFGEIIRAAPRASFTVAYSEGVFEDVNKAALLRSAWDPDVTAEMICREYATLYFPSAGPAEFAELMRLLEANAAHWPSREDADRMKTLSGNIRRRLAPKEKGAWRWRVIEERIVIDRAIASALGGGARARRRSLNAVAEAVKRLRAIYREPRGRIPNLNGPTVAARLLDFSAADEDGPGRDGVDPNA